MRRLGLDFELISLISNFYLFARVGRTELCNRSDLLSPDSNHANQPKPVKFPAESKFAWKNTKKQTSWKKLCET